MNIKGVGIGRGVAVGPVIRMAAPLPEPSDAPRAESISAETEIARVEKSLALVNAIKDIEERLMNTLGTKVNISTGNKKGKIEIEYYTDDDLNDIIDRLLEE